MKMKLNATELRHQLVTGTFTEAQPQLALVLSWLLNFILGFVLSAVPLARGCGPFGISAVAQAGTGLGGLCCALGASCGYLLFFGFQRGIQYVAAVILVFTALFSTRELKLRYRSFFPPSVAAFFTLLTGFLGFYTSEAGKSMVLPLISETILAFGCTYFFGEALRTEERTTEAADLRHMISVIILISCLLMALSRAEIVHTLSIGRVLSLLLVQLAGFCGGPLSGAAAGLILGSAMDVSSGAGVFYSFSYAAAAMVAGVFSRHGKFPYIIVFFAFCTAAVFGMINSGLRLELLYENFSASVIFMVLPAGWVNRIGVYFRSQQTSSGESGIRRYAARRVERMSVAFRDLYTTVNDSLSGEHNDENIRSVFDRASDQVCSRCKNKSKCWNSDYMDTLAAFGDATVRIRSRGMLVREDLPEHFLESCLFPDELIHAVNGELRAMTYRRQYRARLAENRSAAYQQFLDLAEVLSGVTDELLGSCGTDVLAQRRLSRFLASLDLDADLSVFRDSSGRLHILAESPKLKRLLNDPAYLDRISEAVGVRLCRPIGTDEKAEGRITFLEAEPLSVSVGVASMKKTGENVSGDRGTYFKTEQGILCVLLSDGMGSGEGAAKESVAAVRILERFLRAGVEPSLAMRMLNSVMLLKNEDSWGFATVDLLCIDLFSGDACFYKYGAAPSYVHAGKQVRRVRSESLAAGLTAGDGTGPDAVHMRLRPGNVALIASDGVIAETNDEWIRALLSESGNREMKDLAKEALRTAVKHYGITDDMTVLTVRLDKRA